MYERFRALISSHRQSCEGVHLITPTALQTSGVCTAKRVAASPHKHVCSFRQTLSRTRSLDEAAHDGARAHGTNIAIDAEGENEDQVDKPGVVRQPRHVASHSSFPGPAYL